MSADFDNYDPELSELLDGKARVNAAEIATGEYSFSSIGPFGLGQTTGAWYRLPPGQEALVN
jgi:hypothetical protein